MKKLYEIQVDVSYVIVIAADSRKQALAHVDGWEHAWDGNADLLGASKPEVVDVRKPDSQDEQVLNDLAHVVL